MRQKKNGWNAKNVILVRKEIEKKERDLLLTELAQILYDYSCRLRKQSSPDTDSDFEGLKHRRSVNE